MENCKPEPKRTVTAAVLALTVLIPLSASAQRGWFKRAPKPASVQAAPKRAGNVEMTPDARTRLRASSMNLHAAALEQHANATDNFHSVAKAQRRAAKDVLFPSRGNQLVARQDLLQQVEAIVAEEARALHVDMNALSERVSRVVNGPGSLEDAEQEIAAIFAPMANKEHAQAAISRMEERIGRILRSAEETLQPKRVAPAPSPAHLEPSEGQATVAETGSNP
jgi:hypothetical protein